MKPQHNVIDCYNKTARSYADKFLDELDKKHFDRMLLSSFAEENKYKGRCIDLGCGPGQTTRFLQNCGLIDIVGTDISPVMIEVAAGIFPELQFETADMLQLPYENNHFASAIAFYSIVHFNAEQLALAFREIKRILSANGQFLFSFHVGNNTIHHERFLDEEVNIDFHFFETRKIIGLLKGTGFQMVDVIEREPYEGIEYASKRAYVWVEK